MRATGAARARRCCCTASPARARPRSTCAPPRPRSQRDRGVIVLVPEIALTPQIVGRFVDRFGDTVAVLHSKLAAGERHDEWSRLRAGNARVCVGPRSAVFAPIERLGLIVVDEEHDCSYKHEGDPRYDARHVADRRAEQAGALLVAGSATPRPESVHALRRVRLPARVDGRPLPPVQVVDMREQPRRPAPRHEPRARRRAQGDRPAQPPRLVELRRLSLLRARLDLPAVRRLARPAPRQDDARLPSLRPSRARAAALHEVRLGLGRAPRRRHRAPRARARAGRPRGVSPRRRRARRRARCCAASSRAARDPARHADGRQGPRLPRRDARRRRRRRRHAALPGLPRRGADVRARRPARGPRRPRPGGGRVLVQTIAPDAASIAAAARHDADGFLDGELARREALRYPPFSDLIRIVCSATDPQAVVDAATAVRAALGDDPGRDDPRARAAVSAARARARPARRQGGRAGGRRARGGRRGDAVAGERRGAASRSPSTSIRSRAI